MRILIYKRTHNGDPDENGCFGARDCMGSVRDWDYDAVIGVGGIGRKARANGIAGLVTWIGIGPHKQKTDKRGSKVTFDHFHYFGGDGPEFRALAPVLAERMYARNVRRLLHGLSAEERSEATNIIQLARDSPPSRSRQYRAGNPASARPCNPKS